MSNNRIKGSSKNNHYVILNGVKRSEESPNHSMRTIFEGWKFFVRPGGFRKAVPGVFETARNLLAIILSILCISSHALAQSDADSVTITFRAYEASNVIMFVPGEFNNWGNNSSGVINANDASRMLTYDTLMSCWQKGYTFKIKAPNENRRMLADTIFQYKFNKGGGSNSWYSDPLNREQNAGDNSNSILRLSKLFWFEYNQVLTSNNISRITIGLIHANSDTITSISLSTATTQTSPLTTIDVTSAYNSSTRILDTILASSIPKTNYIKLVAYNNHGDSVVYAKGGYVPTTSPKPGYAKNGVTLPSGARTKTTFYVELSTSKEFVLLRLAPTGQSLETAIPLLMKKNTANTGWWVDTLLASGTYEYAYEVSTGEILQDPWGRQVTPGGNSVFSVGPEGLTYDNYSWNSTGFVRPSLNKLVLYELNVAEFAGGRFGLNPGQVKWSHMISCLPYLDSLGINGIELMPVTDYGNIGSSGFSWGYDVNSYLALEPSFGTPGEFKEFVDSAHNRGIAVVMDMVFNHLNETSTLWKMLPNEAQNPYIKLNSDLRPNEDNLAFFKDLDHWTTETQTLVYTALKMWIDDYHIDGFRYDYTQGIGWSRNDTTHGVLGWANKIAKDYNNSIYQISEHLPESPALIYYSGLTSSWHDSFRDEMFNNVIQGHATSLTNFESLIIGLGAYASNDTPSVPSSYGSRLEPVNANSNHDEQGLFFEMVTFQNVDTATALLRDKLYSTFMFASLGVPMLWEGTEFSAPRGWHNDGERLAYRPVEWDVYNSERGKEHFDYYHTLVMQRKLNPALYRGNLITQWKYNSERVLVWGFEDSLSGAKVEIIANLSNASKTVSNVPWLESGIWYDVFNKNTYIVDSTVIESVTIPAYTARVYSNKSDSDLGIPLAVNDPGLLPDKFILTQNYPNPFNPSTTIHYELPKRTQVSLKIFDVTGKEVATLINGEQPSGRYDINWNAKNAASGVYFYRLMTKEGSVTKKLLLMR